MAAVGPPPGTLKSTRDFSSLTVGRRQSLKPHSVAALIAATYAVVVQLAREPPQEVPAFEPGLPPLLAASSEYQV